MQNIVPNVGLGERESKEVGNDLIKIFSDEFMLSTTATNFAYNVLGSRHEILRKFFCHLGKKFCNSAHRIGEQLRELGFRVPNVSEIWEFARIEPLKEKKMV